MENLGEDATIFVKNENKLNQMLPGDQILQSLELLAKVEPVIEKSIPEFQMDVNAERLQKNPYDIMPKLDPKVKYSQGRGFRDLYQKQQKDTKEWNEVVLDSKTSQYDIMPKLTASTIPAKAKETLTKTENALLRRIGKALSVPVGVQRSDLKELVRSISNEYLRDGTVSQESLDALFDEAYEKGVEVDTEYYDQHKDIKDLV